MKLYYSVIDVLRKYTIIFFTILYIISFFILYISDKFNIVFGYFFLFIFLGLLFLIISVRYELFISIFIIVYVNCIFFIDRLLSASFDFPISIVVEGLTLLAFLILLAKRNISGFNNKIGILTIVWLFLNILELVNPMAASINAWFYAVRGIISMILMYFIFYSTIKSRKHIYLILSVWLFFGFVGALYGLYQFYVGPPKFELNWLQADELRLKFFYAWGRLRIFSIFSDPKDFGLNMAFSAMMAIVLLFNKSIKFIFKIPIFLVAIFCLWALIFSGIRTATILVFVGVFIFLIIDFNKHMVMLGMLLIFTLPILIFLSNRIDSLYIMRSAFNTEEDASFNVRIENQKFIRKYILRAPFGYGIGTTGEWGAKFAPGHFLSGFPPDSEFVRVGVENGWLGLLYWSVFLGIVFSVGISRLFAMEDPELRNLLAVILVVFFIFVVSMYPQESLRTYTLITLFSILLSIISKLSYDEL